jgi:DNA invertase Pin-like site-specific DNA recombinase
MQCVGYVRVSSKAQDHTSQRTELERGAQVRGDTIARW